MAHGYFLVRFPSQPTHYIIYNLFSGVECTDVTIVSGLVIPGLSIGASASEDFDDVGGILR